MERPLCPLCKTKHFAREPHAFKGEVEVQSASRKAGDGAPEKADVKVLEGQVSKSGFDRVRYQREYMRKRRASKRLG